MSNITEAEVREASGDELNKLVGLWCERDDLSCFDSEGNEREERIERAIYHLRKHWDSLTWWYEFDGSEDRFQETEISQEVKSRPDAQLDSDRSFWVNRHGKPYQADLEAHVNNWRAKARNFEGNMNLAMTLIEIFSFTKFAELCHCVHISRVNDLPEILTVSGSLDKPAQAICRAAVILAIRKRGE